jgi:hypothetical protein
MSFLHRAIVAGPRARVWLNSHVAKSHCKVELKLLLGCKVERIKNIRYPGCQLPQDGHIHEDLSAIFLTLHTEWQPFRKGTGGRAAKTHAEGARFRRWGRHRFGRGGRRRA